MRYYWRIRLRPRWLPWCWRRITVGNGLASYSMKRDWQLVLDSRAIPFLVVSISGQDHIYAPPMLEMLARREIADYYRENQQIIVRKRPYPVFARIWPAPFFLAPLTVFYGMSQGWWPAPGFLPNPADWANLGCLDGIKVLIYHEWYRIFTSLTLHASSPHLAGNILFGSIFLIILSRLAGAGRAFLLAILSGGLGNLASVLLHEAAYKSVGFSTAVFAMVGATGGMMLFRASNKKKMLMPLAASIGILAMLGTEGENADYVAHIAGLAMGTVTGIVEGWRIEKGWPNLPGAIAGFLGLALLAGSWLFAFNIL